MKKTLSAVFIVPIVLSFLCLGPATLQAQDTHSKKTVAAPVKPGDSKKPKKDMKAQMEDMPEMKEYFLVLLKKGPVRTQDSLTAAKIQEGHMANIVKGAADKIVAVAGPMGDDGDLRGIFILTVKTMEDAKAFCDKDPAVASGRLVAEIHPWWCKRGVVIP
ncbi:MAG: hypothetical protein V4543_05620 [Bacteroidota bacterium]